MPKKKSRICCEHSQSYSRYNIRVVKMQISTALTRRPYGRIMTHVLNFGGDISWKVITWKTGKDMLETLFGHE
jgi:hypothetical protein